MPELKLGVNLCFVRKRWTEPEEWVDKVRNDLDLDVIEFCSDLLDPLLMPQGMLDEKVGRFRELTDKNGIEVYDYYTGVITHCLNLLSDPDERMRETGFKWCRGASKLAAAMGAKSIGGHFDTIPSADINDPKRYAACIDRCVETAQRVAREAKAEGMEFVQWEQMYAPSEVPYTHEQTVDFHARANDGAAIPITITVDVGHMACHNFPHEPRDRDPYSWLREFGAISPIIHLQQTKLDGSSHWPFTPECNAKGDLDAEKIVQALEESGSKQNYLMLEIFHSLATSDQQILDDHAESVRFWRKFI